MSGIGRFQVYLLSVIFRRVSAHETNFVADVLAECDEHDQSSVYHAVNSLYSRGLIHLSPLTSTGMRGRRVTLTEDGLYELRRSINRCARPVSPETQTDLEEYIARKQTASARFCAWCTPPRALLTDESPDHAIHSRTNGRKETQ